MTFFTLREPRQVQHFQLGPRPARQRVLQRRSTAARSAARRSFARGTGVSSATTPSSPSSRCCRSTRFIRPPARCWCCSACCSAPAPSRSTDSRRDVSRRPWLLLVTLGYLVYPPMHGAQFFDFHFQPAAAAFVLDGHRRLRRQADAALRRLLAAGARMPRGRLDRAHRRSAFSWSSPATGDAKGRSSPRSRRSTSCVMRFFLMPAVGSWGFCRSLPRPRPRRATRASSGW